MQNSNSIGRHRPARGPASSGALYGLSKHDPSMTAAARGIGLVYQKFQSISVSMFGVDVSNLKECSALDAHSVHPQSAIEVQIAGFAAGLRN